VVERLTPLLGCSDGYAQVLFNLALPDKFLKSPWAQAGIKLYILGAGFAGYNTLYLSLTP